MRFPSPRTGVAWLLAPILDKQDRSVDYAGGNAAGSFPCLVESEVARGDLAWSRCCSSTTIPSSPAPAAGRTASSAALRSRTQRGTRGLIGQALRPTRRSSAAGLAATPTG